MSNDPTQAKEIATQATEWFGRHGIDLRTASEEKARLIALQLSAAVPDQYVTVVACHGLYAAISEYMSPLAAYYSHFNWYAFGGELRTFSEPTHQGQ